MILCLAERNHKYFLLIIGVCIPPIHLNHFHFESFMSLTQIQPLFSEPSAVIIIVSHVTIYVYVATVKWGFQSSWH